MLSSFFLSVQEEDGVSVLFGDQRNGAEAAADADVPREVPRQEQGGDGRGVCGAVQQRLGLQRGAQGAPESERKRSIWFADHHEIKPQSFFFFESLAPVQGSYLGCPFFHF